MSDLYLDRDLCLRTALGTRFSTIPETSSSAKKFPSRGKRKILIILSDERARSALDEIGAHQRVITEGGGNARTGADAIAELLEAVVFFFDGAGYDPIAVRQELLQPMQQWLIYTIAPRWLQDGDPAQSDSKYLFDKLSSLLSRVGVND